MWVCLAKDFPAEFIGILSTSFPAFSECLLSGWGFIWCWGGGHAANSALSDSLCNTPHYKEVEIKACLKGFWIFKSQLSTANSVKKNEMKWLFLFCSSRGRNHNDDERKGNDFFTFSTHFCLKNSNWNALWVLRQWFVTVCVHSPSCMPCLSVSLSVPHFIISL